MFIKKHRPGRKKKAVINREQWLCLAAGAALSILYVLNSYLNSGLTDGRFLKRNRYSGPDSRQELVVEGLFEEDRKVNITVSHRKYTKEEAHQLFSRILETVCIPLLAGNESTQAVCQNLNFVKNLPAYEGITLNWMPQDLSLIDQDGTVLNETIEEPRETGVLLTMKTGDIKEDFLISLTVRPKHYTSEENLLRHLEKALEQADERTVSGDYMELPSTVDGKRIRFRPAMNGGGLKIFAVTLAAFGLIGLRPGEAERKKKKERETELIRDYPELVSRLLVYTGAGLTLRNAWKRIVEVYQSAVASGLSKRRVLFEEMGKTGAELDNGVAESRAYMTFARACGPKCYLRLIALLEQNRRTGDASLRNALELEMEEAFEQRINTAKRLGEEAGTRLMAPLMISLVTIMVIVIVPAMMTLS